MINGSCTGVLLGPVIMAVLMAVVHVPHIGTLTGLSVDTLPQLDTLLMVPTLAFWGCGDTDLVSGCLCLLLFITCFVGPAIIQYYCYY